MNLKIKAIENIKDKIKRIVYFHKFLKRKKIKVGSCYLGTLNGEYGRYVITDIGFDYIDIVKAQMLDYDASERYDVLILDIETLYKPVKAVAHSEGDLIHERSHKNEIYRLREKIKDVDGTYGLWSVMKNSPNGLDNELIEKSKIFRHYIEVENE